MTEIKKNLVDLKTVLKEAEKYDQTELATLSNDFTIEFYPHFANDKIEKVIEQLGAFTNSQDKDSQSFVELISSSEENFVLLIYFFVTKEFTHLGVDMEDKETPAELFPYYKALITTGYLTELVEDVFLPEELQKVIKRTASISALNEHINQIGINYMEEFAKHKEKIERVTDTIKRTK